MSVCVCVCLRVSVSVCVSVKLSERAQLGAQALESLSNGQSVSDQLVINIIAAAVRSYCCYTT